MTTPCDSRSFLQQGFARFDNMINTDELTILSEIYDQIFTDVENNERFINLGGIDQDGNLLMPQVSMPSQSHPELHDLEYFKKLEQLAQKLLGPKATFRNDHMILKPVGSNRDTPWHQDQSYHSPLFRYTNVNFWLPLDGASIEEGCLWFVPKTHSGTVVPHENNYQNGGGATATSAKNQDYWQANGVPVPCPVGSISAHHSYCMHYAAANKGSKARRAWINVFACPPVELETALVMPWQDERQQLGY
ncbi:MAG: phytanoyl-CoA dioxygenase family protein [Planctomycetes bacterium]|nr:phytanoyl-CoA dioxygenase family protein [Planctomycetota bacterium]